MSALAGCAAFTFEEWTILANPVSWTSMHPYTVRNSRVKSCFVARARDGHLIYSVYNLIS